MNALQSTAAASERVFNFVDEEEMVIMMPDSILPGFTQMLGLSDPDDYSIDETNKMIILTATGYQTGGEFFSMLFQEEADD